MRFRTLARLCSTLLLSLRPVQCERRFPTLKAILTLHNRCGAFTLLGRCQHVRLTEGFGSLAALVAFNIGLEIWIVRSASPGTCRANHVGRGRSHVAA